MVLENEYVGIAEIAKALGQNKNTVSNWMTRDANAPKPYMKNAASQLWYAKEIAEYLKKRGYEVLVLPNTQGKTGKIVIMGRARLGKSFFVAILCENGKLYSKTFCSGGGSKTACPVLNVFIDADFDEFIKFHSDFNTIYKDDEEKDELAQLKKKVEQFVKKEYSFNEDNSEDVLKTIKDIEDLVRKMKAFEEKYPNRKDSNTYLEVYLRPDSFLRNVMRECSLRRLEVLDTPGVSGNVMATKLSKANMYIIALKADDNEEAKTLTRIVEEVKPYAATSKVVFMYKKEAVITSKKKYETKTTEAQEDMREFESIFEPLKGPIIYTDAEILNPAGNTVMFPTMDADLPLAKELFLETMRERLIAAFDTTTAEADEEERFKKVLQEKGTEAENFSISLMKNIPQHELEKSCDEFTQNDFRNGGHARVKANDGYRLRNDLDVAYGREVMLLDKYFSQFDEKNTPEEWKQTIIRYIYRRISKSLKSDRGVGIGAHPWEENPPRTMLIEESVNANTVLDYLEGEEMGKLSMLYKKALQDSKISATDKSWTYVGVTNEEEGLRKLKIIMESLSKIRVYDRVSMVLVRYVGGLRKMAEYDILRTMGQGEREAMAIVAQMPF